MIMRPSIQHDPMSGETSKGETSKGETSNLEIVYRTVHGLEVPFVLPTRQADTQHPTDAEGVSKLAPGFGGAAGNSRRLPRLENERIGPMKTKKIQDLVEKLASENGVDRMQAREQLVAAGGYDVTRALIAELVDPRQHVRWEAALALKAMADPIAALPLVHAMDDDDEDVRWVAAEGVAGLGEPGLLAVLSGLTRASKSSVYCTAAHQALRELRDHGVHREIIESVMPALEGSERNLSGPIAAYQALQKLRGA